MTNAARAADGSLAGTSVVVVGGGFGGLSTACYLARAGADVRVVEKNEQLGGRASRLERDGFTFDMGPSWYLMPDVFERFFSHFGKRPADYYDLERLDPHYRVFWKDGDRADVSDDLDAVRTLFESYEPGAADALDDYLATSEAHYRTAMDRFVYEDRPRWRDYVDPAVLRAAPVGLTLLGTMDEYVAKYFEHPKLRQLMQYTLVFLGGAPKNTPAMYNIMAHVDFNMGVWYPRSQADGTDVTDSGGAVKGGADTDEGGPGVAGSDGGRPGGLGAVVDGLVALAEELGVEFTLDTEVVEITRRKEGFHVEAADGTVFRPDLVVSDADYAHTETELLPAFERQFDDDYWEDRTLAPSAFLLYLGVEGDVDELAHHTLVLPTDWDEHFEQLFDDPAWPADPAYYCCVPSKTDDAVAPDGHSNLFVLVPVAPGLDDTPAIRQEYRDYVLGDLADNTGVDLRDRVVVEESFCVSDFAERYNARDGTALGLAHTLRQTALLRPPRRSTAVEGLYYTGGYTTPGIGVPMCLISGEHTADAVLEDHPLPSPAGGIEPGAAN